MDTDDMIHSYWISKQILCILKAAAHNLYRLFQLGCCTCCSTDVRQFSNTLDIAQKLHQINMQSFPTDKVKHYKLCIRLFRNAEKS